jgi:hypothetical protein
MFESPGKTMYDSETGLCVMASAVLSRFQYDWPFLPTRSDAALAPNIEFNQP